MLSRFNQNLSGKYDGCYKGSIHDDLADQNLCQDIEFGAKCGTENGNLGFLGYNALYFEEN